MTEAVSEVTPDATEVDRDPIDDFKPTVKAPRPSAAEVMRRGREATIARGAGGVAAHAETDEEAPKKEPVIGTSLAL